MTKARTGSRPLARYVRSVAFRRWVLSLLSVILALVIGWQVLVGLSSGFRQLVGVASSAGSSPKVQLQRTYVVAPGDSLGSIAGRFGVSTRLLAQANHLAHPDVIVAGQTLIIPSAYHPGLTRQLVERTATSFHLDPTFAEAIAYQESGFNQNVVSPTGAIGVMQVEPGTARLVASQLRRSFDLGVESDNVTVGVYWLAYLVRYYGGDETKAAAAYYEGQGNLASRGYLTGTQQYVDSVMALRRQFSRK